jgi:membrane protein implicated in regulation of membrane protease activity
METSDWAWVWMVLAAGALIGEMMTPGSFFLLPFAIGAGVATVAAFADGSVAMQWVLFLGVSALGSIALIPLRRRLDATPAVDGIGARRLVNQQATVLDAISAGPDGIGSIRVGREEWRAVSAGSDAIEAGATVVVVEVRGTSAVVIPDPSSPHGGTP